MPMTDLLRRAVARAARLPSAEQNALAAFVLAELDGPAGWEAVFERDDDAEADDDRPRDVDGRAQAARRYG